MDQGLTTEQWYSKLFRVFNSAVCFALAYVLLNYAYWFATALAGKLVKFDAFVYYYGVKFILNNHRWNTVTVTLIYLAGPVFCLLAGLLCFYIYRIVQFNKSMLNIFLLWVFVLGSAMFASQGIIAILGTHMYQSDFYSGMAVVFSWWGVPRFFVYVLGIPISLFSLYVSVNYSRPFLLLAYSYSKVNKLSRRRKYFFETAFVPFATGALGTGAITILMHLPPHINIPIHLVYMGVTGLSLILSWFAISYIEVLKKDITRFKALQTPNLTITVLLGIALVLVYITFRGIYIG